MEELSIALNLEFPGVIGYSKRNLARMKKFYEEYENLAILPPAVAKLPWIHNCILVDKIKNMDVRLWYAQKTIENGWSKRVLDHRLSVDWVLKSVNVPVGIASYNVLNYLRTEEEINQYVSVGK